MLSSRAARLIVSISSAHTSRHSGPRPLTSIDASPSAISAKVTGPDLSLYKLLQERHVLVASDSVPQGFERRFDNLARRSSALGVQHAQATTTISGDRRLRAAQHDISFVPRMA